MAASRDIKRARRAIIAKRRRGKMARASLEGKVLWREAMRRDRKACMADLARMRKEARDA